MENRNVTIAEPMARMAGCVELVSDFIALDKAIFLTKNIDIFYLSRKTYVVGTH